jgi:hypothetical protein
MNTKAQAFEFSKDLGAKKASILTWAVRLTRIDQRPRLATKHNKSPGQAWGISNPASLVRRFVQVFRLNLTTSGGPC